MGYITHGKPKHYLFMYRIVLSFLLSFILLMVVIALNRHTYNKAQTYTRQADHSRNVIKAFDAIDVQLRSAEIYSPVYENAFTKQLYSLYKADLEKIIPGIDSLRILISDNKQQARIVDSIGAYVQKHLPTLRQKNMAEITQAGEIWRLEDLNKTHLLVRNGLALEEDLLAIRKKEVTETNRLNNTLTLLLAIFAAAIITVTFISQIVLSKRRVWLEGFLESILNTSQNGVVYYKALRTNGAITDFKVEYANASIAKMFDVDIKKFVGKRLSEMDSYVRKSDLYAMYIKAIELGAPVQTEYFYSNNNLEKWLYLSISKLNDGITVAFHDISELKRYEDELKKNITALEQSNRELEEYAYAASHDLQEPLRKIRTFGGFLQDTQQEKMDEKGKLHLAKLVQSAERMTLLIKDLLTFSSLKQKEAFEPTDLNQILENVLQDLEVAVQQSGAVITHDVLPELDAIPVQMNQLFYNLVNNSVKFAKTELPLQLNIHCSHLAQEEAKRIFPHANSAYYEIVFSDNGIGFNPDYAHQIFGLFKRLNDKSRYAGSGIGLSLCKKVVMNHGGYVEATGKEGLGAQFYIYLPQTQPNA